MVSKTTIKFVRSLRDQKYRQKYHKIVVEGAKTVRDVLEDRLLEIDTIYATSTWVDVATSSSEFSLPPVVVVDDREMTGISSFTTPQQVLAVCTMPDHTADPQKAISELCLYLDGIRDPGNMGTIFRIADWFGIGNIFLAEDSVDPFNPKVIQASMGSLFRVHWSEIPLQEILLLPGLQVYATSLDGENIYTGELSGQGLIVFGNESTGIRALTSHPGIRRISIPADYRLGADSLNVAVAAGIICAEFRRRAEGERLRR